MVHWEVSIVKRKGEKSRLEGRIKNSSTGDNSFEILIVISMDKSENYDKRSNKRRVTEKSRLHKRVFVLNMTLHRSDVYVTII
jgi:hypothetical protein